MTVSTNPALQLGKGKATLPLRSGGAHSFQAQPGEHYRIVKGEGEDALLDNVVAKRIDNDLRLTYADGTSVTLENYFLECKAGKCSATLPDAGGGGYVVGAEGAAGVDLSDGSTLVYAHGSSDALMTLAQGDDALKTALSSLTGPEL